MRLLFCLPSTQISGGLKVIFQLVNQLKEMDESVDVFSFAGFPKWFPLNANLIEAKDFDAIDMAAYDFVLLANAFMVPMVLPRLQSARCILFCQDYESYHHARGQNYRDFISDSPTFTKIYELPVPKISISRAVQSLLKERAGSESFYLPMGLNKGVFAPQKQKAPTEFKRVLMVGNYLMPYKGMKDGFEALAKLSTEMPVQLVMATQESRGRAIFENLKFPIELHYCPTEEQMPAIISSCDTYCCTSWYEGLGLPAIEAFRCGVPVVSTRTFGVSDYGIDNVNMLLAQPNDPHDIYLKLQRLLSDESLAERLRREAFKSTEERYDWSTSAKIFMEHLDEIDRTYEGAGRIDPGEMQLLLDDLEREGNLTPIAVYRRFQELATALKTLAERLRTEKHPDSEMLKELSGLRDEFRPYLANEKAEYYDAFKAKYDWCQLILSLKDNVRFSECLELMLTRRQEREPRTAASFSEIRYSVQ